MLFRGGWDDMAAKWTVRRKSSYNRDIGCLIRFWENIGMVKGWGSSVRPTEVGTTATYHKLYTLHGDPFYHHTVQTPGPRLRLCRSELLRMQDHCTPRLPALASAVREERAL